MNEKEEQIRIGEIIIIDGKTKQKKRDLSRDF